MRFASHLEAEAVERLHPAARAALEALDTWATEKGWEELLVVELVSERDDWARAGCGWCVRLRVYSRPQRQALLNHLRNGRRAPEWLVLESGDVARCVVRDFPWRKERLGHEPGGSHGGAVAVQAAGVGAGGGGAAGGGE